MAKQDFLKDYVEVNVRVEKFWQDYPDGRILTEIIKWEDDVITMKASIYKDNKNEHADSTGHAYEKEGSTYINKTSALENCETSAVGRALALMGYEIKKSIASKEEVENAVHQQENIKSVSELSEKQIKRIFGIAYSKGLDANTIKAQIKKKFNKEIKDLSKSEYDTVCKGYSELDNKK